MPRLRAVLTWVRMVSTPIPDSSEGVRSGLMSPASVIRRAAAGPGAGPRAAARARARSGAALVPAERGSDAADDTQGDDAPMNPSVIFRPRRRFRGGCGGWYGPPGGGCQDGPTGPGGGCCAGWFQIGWVRPEAAVVRADSTAVDLRA